MNNGKEIRRRPMVSERTAAAGHYCTLVQSTRVLPLAGSLALLALA
jgi:hypothetical protein